MAFRKVEFIKDFANKMNIDLEKLTEHLNKEFENLDEESKKYVESRFNNESDVKKQVVIEDFISKEELNTMTEK